MFISVYVCVRTYVCVLVCRPKEEVGLYVGSDVWKTISRLCMDYPISIRCLTLGFTKSFTSSKIYSLLTFFFCFVLKHRTPIPPMYSYTRFKYFITCNVFYTYSGSRGLMS